MKPKLIILGGGASGLMAACAAARILKTSGEVTVLEGNGKPGRKLLATGNGRCNLTNAARMDTGCYFGDSEAAAPLLAAYPPARIRSAFSEMGLETVADAEGRVYPRSMQSSSVLSVLRREAETLGVTVRCGVRIAKAGRTEEKIRLTAESGERFAGDACVLAVGGAAAPKLSLGADGYALARSLGHSVTALCPALTGLRCASSRKVLRPLAGVRVSAAVSLRRDGECLSASAPGARSEVIFSEDGISGISVFDLTAQAYGPLSEARGGCALALNLFPDLSEAEISDTLRTLRKKYPDSPAGELTVGLLPAQVGWAVTGAAGIEPKAPAGTVPDGALQRAAHLFKHWTFPVSGTRDFEHAQITAGGVPMREVDPRTLRSLRTPGLYLAGELLNVHGRCGGYNLHFAWATGLAAGTAAAEVLREAAP